MAAAEFIAGSGAHLEVVSPERYFAPEMGGLNLVPYMKIFEEHKVTITTVTRVRALRREGNKIAASLWSPYAEKDTGSRLVDQVVVENATLPMDDLYFALKPGSRNLGAVDYEGLVGGGAMFPAVNPEAGFILFRIGDAVASRNIHAAIYDGIRYAVRL